jgi:hypothetical protein
MFDFYNTMKTYTYDVCSTLGRMASSMLNKGVELKVGPNACTDGEKTIWLPQAMKRSLAWDEIDFVRYLVHHEYAHIQHSQPKQDMLLLGRDGSGSDPLYAHIVNCLEDVRIEAVASQEMMMRGVYQRGQNLCRKMLAKQRSDYAEDYEWTLRECLSYVLIQCTHHPDMGDATALRATGQPRLELLHFTLEKAGILKGVEFVNDNPDSFPLTSEILPLANRIYSLLHSLNGNGMSPEDLEKKCQAQEGIGGGGLPEGGGEGETPEDNPEFEEAIQKLCDAVNMDDGGNSRDAWGEGAVEQAAQALSAGVKDGQLEDSISEKDIRGSSNGLSFGTFTDRRGRQPDRAYSIENYRWGMWAAGMAQQVVDKLRGMSRASYSQPKDSGIRIAQKSVPAFLRGLTANVLKRRHRDRVRGTAVAMLIDDSGSMGWDESQNAWRSACMLCVACERAKIPSLIIRYSDDFAVEKRFGQPIGRVAHRMGKAWGGGTEALDAIEQGIIHLSLRNESRRVLFFLTDGCTEDCRSLVQKCRNDGIEFIPILFGNAAVHAAKRGGVWDLPGTIALPDTDVALGPILVERLAATL